MTVIPKSSTMKKGDKLEVPLVVNVVPTAGRALDAESLHMQRRAHKISHMTTCCLLLTALAVVGLGIIGGTFLYDQYMRVHVRSDKINLNIPYKGELTLQQIWDDYDNSDYDYDNSQLDDKDINDLVKSRMIGGYLDDGDMNGQFPEELQIAGDVENIHVPDFNDGRDGRFIHDFNSNTTGIIDVTGNRCFVMPLNRATVLPPKSLFDLLHKMWEGYYTVDTNVVRHTMRVITPPVDDAKTVGSYIGKECEGKPIYKLEKYVSGVVKRSADHHESAKFTEFAGQVSEIDIVNYKDVEAFEKAQH